MSRSFRIRLAVIVLTALLGTIGTVAAGWSPSLGLDLQGGTSVVLEPKGDVAPDVLDRTIGIIRSRVDSLGVAEPDISRQGDRSIVVSLPGVKDSNRALDIVGKTAQLTFRPVLGDLPSENEAKAQSATTPDSTTRSVTVGDTTAASSAAPTSTVAGNAVTTVKATTGATSATTAPTVASSTAPTAPKPAETTAPAASSQALGMAQGGGRFGVLAQAGDTTAPPTTAKAPATTTAPASTAPGAATTALGAATTAPATTAPGAVTTVPGAVTSTPASTVSGAATTTVAPAPPITTDVNAAALATGATTKFGEDSPEFTVILPEKRNDPDSRRYLLGPAEIQGAIVDTASAVVSQTGQWTVDLNLNSRGSALWDAMAEKYFQQRIAIVLDGEALSAPVIQERRFGGRAQISGNFNQRDAKDLATALKFGSLPVTLVPQTVQNVSASLGKDSLRAGIFTGAIGLLLVAAYMIFYYRRLGLVVVLGLLVSGGLMWSLVSFLSEKQGLALSLSGVVGIIVSFGTTVDSYVVFFERMRDELRAGRNAAQSVDRGFKSAFRTIIAADFTSLIGAGVLYFLTVGSVRGFALFLLISTTLDLVVAWAFTRPIVTLIAERQMRKGAVGGAGDGPTKLTPSGGRLVPGSANAGAQL